MKSVYLKTNWIDNKTPVNAANLNNIEKGVDLLFRSSISPSELLEGDGITLEQGEDGTTFSVDETIARSKTESGFVLRTKSLAGVEYTVGELASYEPEKVYFVLSEEYKLTKIVINNRVVYEVE